MCLLAGITSANVADLEAMQAANGNIQHQFTFEGTYNSADATGAWLDNKAAASPSLIQDGFEDPTRTANKVNPGYDISSSFADFSSFASGVKGDALKSSATITYAASGTIEYLVQFGNMDGSRYVINGDGSGANDRLRFMVIDSTGSKAMMQMGANIAHDLIGGTTSVAYGETGDWYYVAQNWSISGGTVTMDAWVANLTAGGPLTKTINGASNVFDGNTTTILNLGGAANTFADFGMDALAIYDRPLNVSEIEEHMEIATSGSIQREFWVSPSGDDSNPGTLLAPFHTIQKAQNTVKSLLNSQPITGDTVVYLRAGDYFLDSEIVIRNTDFLCPSPFKVVYKNWDEVGSPRIILGTRITGGWTEDPDMPGVWTTYISTNIAIDSLYHNEQRGHIARYPNRKSTPAYPASLGEYLIAESGSSTNLQYYPGDLNPNTWTLSYNPKMCVWVGTSGYQDWGLLKYSITSADATNRILGTGGTSYPIANRDRYYLEGVLEFLDEPGEFLFDQSSGLLRYMSITGGNPSTNVIIPHSGAKAFNIAGSETNYVKNLSFEGLYFWCARVGGIALKYTENISIINCHFKFIGNEAITMYRGNLNNLVYGCWIEHCGWGGVFINNDLDRTVYPDNISSGHVIQNCKIQDVSSISCHATENGGVIIWNASTCTVANCEIFNTARYATTLRGHYSTQSEPNDNGLHYARDNVFEALEIYCAANDSGDMGVLHAAAINPTESQGMINYWRDITVDHITATPSMQDIRPNGVFLDHAYSTEWQDFENIKLTRVQGDPFRVNHNYNQTVANCSWISGFNESLMATNIGLMADFPNAYSGASTTPTPLYEPYSHRGQIVVDDGATGYSESGMWSASTITNGYGDDARYHSNPSNSTAYAQWTPTISVSGRYGVYVWKCGNDSAAQAAVEYQVSFAGGTLKAFTDQANQTYDGYWEKIGTYYFAAGTSGYVKEIAGAPNWVVQAPIRADAVKFVPEHYDIESIYAAWISQYDVGAETNMKDDPDSDGLDNLSEFSLGGDPANPFDMGHMPTYGIIEAEGTNWFKYVYAKRNDADLVGLAYHLEQNTNLVDGVWINANCEVSGTGVLDAEFNTVTNRVPMGMEAVLFLKLVIETK